MTIKLIYDCDNTMGLRFREVDDGLTILYLLGRADIELVGVTTTFGNGTIDEVCTQTRELLDARAGGRVPMLRGAGAAGEHDTEAAAFLAETVAAAPGEIIVLATGPLGNLAGAAARSPGFLGQVRQIACMGGVLRPLRIGWRTVAELNFSCDPEAAAAVLRAPCPVTLMNAHVCLQAPFGWRELWRASCWDRGTRRVVRNWLFAFGLACGVPVFYLWDLLPAVYLSHPELFEEAPVTLRASVDDLRSGTLVPKPDGAARVNMPPRLLDRGRLMELLFDAWSAPIGS